MTPATAEAGSTANRYQIFARLAVGGMAELYLVRGASVAGVERYCVLKRILHERASDAEFVRMFVDEARLAAQLQHPNIASVYDVGMLGDSYFFTMEYVHGETVRSLLQRAQAAHRPLPLACVLTIIAGAAAGLHHAHERHANDGRPLNIVHRDVSPSNLMVSFEGNVKLVDFGVAKAADRAIETQSGTVKGKISYLSPEQCQGADIDRRSDLFSLGIVMWEMLTGERLYTRANDFGNMTAIVHEMPPRPSTRRADIPRAIDDIVMKLLAKGQGERFQTADQVIEAIEDASMRAGTLLSGSAVARLMRDLFGTRPEPWLTLGLAETPADSAAMTAGSLESELANVPDMAANSTDDLETEAIAEPAKRIAHAPPRVSTLNYPKGLPVAPRKMPTIVLSTPLAAGALSAMARPDKPVYATMLGHQMPASVAAVMFSPSARMAAPPLPASSSGALVVPPELATSSDMIPLPGPLARPSVPELPELPAQAPPSQGKLIAIGAAVIVVAIVLIVIVATRGERPAVVHMAPVAPAAAPPVVAAPVVPPAVGKLRAAYAGKDFAAAVAACKDLAKSADTDVATMCVMSACYRRDSVIARRWLAGVRGDHQKLVADCKQAGNVTIGP